MNNKLLVANLKMHFNYKQIDIWCRQFIKHFKPHKGLVICPPMIHIYQVSEFFRNRGFSVSLGAQKVVSTKEGALTGEITTTMLSGLVDYLIIGHSEQRIFTNPSNQEMAQQIKAALNLGIIPILCVGDSAKQLQSGIDQKIIKDQINSISEFLSAEQIKKIIIAYEPIWAIGSGSTPTNQQIITKFKLISKILTSKISENGYVFANILYGGSVNATNIQHLKAVIGLRGYLVGGASLDAEQLAKMASLIVDQKE